MPVDPNATIEISAFVWVPPFAEGLVRDLRVRWALEEAGLDYRERLLDAATARPDDYFLEQPFGQVPIYNEGEIRMFETGAIVLHIAERTEALMRARPGRARAHRLMGRRLAQQHRADDQRARRYRLLQRRGRVGESPPAGRRTEGARPARPAVGLARRARLSRRPLHGGRPDDDDDAAHPAPHRSRGRASEPRRVPGPLRGKAGVRAPRFRRSSRRSRSRTAPRRPDRHQIDISPV